MALVRLDEWLARGEPDLAAGARARADLFEAQALAHLSGALTALEDLVLHDAGMDVRAPTAGVVRSTRILGDRRKLARQTPASVLAPDSLRSLIGLAGEGDKRQGADEQAAVTAAIPRVAAQSQVFRPWDMPTPLVEDDAAPWPEEDAIDEADGPETPDDDDSDTAAGARAGGGDLAAVDALLARTGRLLDAFSTTRPAAVSLGLRDPGYGGITRLDVWCGVLQLAQSAPAVLAAAIALDAWLTLEPAERAGEVGFALAATVLRQRGVTAHHLPTWGLGYRNGRFRWSPHQAQGVRIAGLLEAIHDSARLADRDLKRLILAREVMLRHCDGRRGNSRLAQLVGLFVASPLVTVPMAAEALAVTPQAVEAMLRQLGPSLPRELTGRKRYRAWGIV